MSYFDKPAFVPDSIAPLTRERITAYLDSCDYNYGIDSDGDVGGNWDGNPFYFFIRGENDDILHIAGRWKARLPMEKSLDLLQFVNDWNRDHIWPKLYTRELEPGLAMVGAETNTELRFGATDAQLGQFITCGLQTASQAFSRLDEQYPEATIPNPEDHVE